MQMFIFAVAVEGQINWKIYVHYKVWYSSEPEKKLGKKNTTEENMKGNEQKMLEVRLVVLWKKIFTILPLHQQLWIINKDKKNSGLGWTSFGFSEGGN